MGSRVTRVQPARIPKGLAYNRPVTITESTSPSNRLSREVLPTDYLLDVDADLEAGTFRGTVTIRAQVHIATNGIRLHSVGLDLADAVVLTNLDDTQPTSHELTIYDEPDREMVWMRVAGAPEDPEAAPRALQPGPIEIRIAYSGTINEGLLGFYRSTFVDEDGVTHTLACTQMEAPYARSVFPCFDEPSFKARFHIALTVDDRLLAVSNSAERSRNEVEPGRVRIEFEPTMVMSTYLVAWVIGPLAASDTRMVGDVPVRVIAPPASLHLSEFALDTAEFALGWFGEYYGITYPGDKVDLIAIPDFAFGAMENLGCVTFREVYLLTDPASATKDDLAKVAAVVNHELAHMWFGDLVTMKWWNGIWLNEAFATFMELACTDAGHPDWDHWTHFGVERSAAFEIDALLHTRPIEMAVSTPDEADAMFDVLTYEKGASILRMLEQFLGEDEFRKGVRHYLGRHAYANTETHDLWEALSEATGTPVTDMMNRWIFEGGHPRVSGRRDGEMLHLAQTRNTAGGVDTEWTPRPTPVRVGWLHGDGSRSSTSLLLTEPAETPWPADAVAATLNGEGYGFYRTALSEELHRELIGRFDQFAPLERFQYLDDAWAGLLANALPLGQLLDSVWAAVGDADSTVMRRAARAWNSMYRLAGDDRTAVSSAISSWVDHAVALRGGTYAGETGAALFALKGSLGAPEPEFLDRARELAGLTGSPTEDQELLTAAVTVVGTWANAQDFDWLLAQVDAAGTPQKSQRFLVALGLANDPELFAQGCEYFLETARPQDGPYALRDAMLHPSNGTAGWEFIERNWTTITERFPSGAIPRMLEGIRWLLGSASVERVQAFIGARDFSGSQTRIDQLLELQTANDLLAQRIRPKLVDSLAASTR